MPFWRRDIFVQVFAWVFLSLCQSYRRSVNPSGGYYLLLVSVVFFLLRLITVFVLALIVYLVLRLIVLLFIAGPVLVLIVLHNKSPSVLSLGKLMPQDNYLQNNIDLFISTYIFL